MAYLESLPDETDYEAGGTFDKETFIQDRNLIIIGNAIRIAGPIALLALIAGFSHNHIASFFSNIGSSNTR